MTEEETSALLLSDSKKEADPGGKLRLPRVLLQETNPGMQGHQVYGMLDLTCSPLG